MKSPTTYHPYMLPIRGEMESHQCYKDTDGTGQICPQEFKEKIKVYEPCKCFPTCQLLSSFSFNSSSSGPQPQVQDGSVPHRTSTASSGWQCSPPDLAPDGSVPRRTSTACQKICQKECQKIRQKECETECQKVCTRVNVRRGARNHVRRYVRRNVSERMSEDIDMP